MPIESALEKIANNPISRKENNAAQKGDGPGAKAPESDAYAYG